MEIGLVHNEYGIPYSLIHSELNGVKEKGVSITKQKKLQPLQPQ